MVGCSLSQIVKLGKPGISNGEWQVRVASGGDDHGTRSMRRMDAPLPINMVRDWTTKSRFKFAEGRTPCCAGLGFRHLPPATRTCHSTARLGCGCAALACNEGLTSMTTTSLYSQIKVNACSLRRPEVEETQHHHCQTASTSCCSTETDHE